MLNAEMPRRQREWPDDEICFNESPVHGTMVIPVHHDVSYAHCQPSERSKRAEEYFYSLESLEYMAVLRSTLHVMY